MKPKHLPRLWCALQGLLPLDGRRLTTREEPWARPSSQERDGVHRISGGDRHLRAVRLVVAKETNAVT